MKHRTKFLAEILFSATVLATSFSAWPQTPSPKGSIQQKSEGDCSPVFTQVKADGDIIINCFKGHEELLKIAQDLSYIRRTQKLSSDQTKALLDSMNAALPTIIASLARIEGKQDITIAGINELLTRKVRSETPPSSIRSSVTSEVNRLVSTPGEAVASSVTSRKLPVYDAIASTEAYPQGAHKAIDGKDHTSWKTRSGETVDAWIELILDRPCVIDELRYHLSLSNFSQSQIREATLIFPDRTTQEVHFEMKDGIQPVSLQSKFSDRVKIMIKSIFPRGKGNQISIKELELYGHDCSN